MGRVQWFSHNSATGLRLKPRSSLIPKPTDVLLHPLRSAGSPFGLLSLWASVGFPVFNVQRRLNVARLPVPEMGPPDPHYQFNPFGSAGPPGGSPCSLPSLAQECLPLLGAPQSSSPCLSPSPFRLRPVTRFAHRVVPSSRWPVSDSSLCFMHKGGHSPNCDTELTTKSDKQGRRAGGRTQEADHEGPQPVPFPFKSTSDNG